MQICFKLLKTICFFVSQSRKILDEGMWVWHNLQQYELAHSKIGSASMHTSGRKDVQISLAVLRQTVAWDLKHC